MEPHVYNMQNKYENFTDKTLKNYEFSRIITNIAKKISFAWTRLTVILYKKIILLQLHYAHVILGFRNQIHFVRYLEFGSNKYTLRLRKVFEGQIVL